MDSSHPSPPDAGPLDARAGDPVRALFERAAACDGADREALLAEARRHAPDICAEVEGVLRHLARDDGVLDRAALSIVGFAGCSKGSPGDDSTLAAVAHEREHGTLPAGARVGRYILDRLVGVGGAAAVYEAYRADAEAPAVRLALKLIRPELVTADMLARFQRESLSGEATLLSAMRHPGLVPIHEIGCAAIGETDGSSGALRPFIAMELVEGPRLLEFARSTSLGVGPGLALIAQVCEALHHAHERGYHHGRLGASSIVVAGQPRVLDVGVAALLGHSLTEELGGLSEHTAPAGADGIGARRRDVLAVGEIMFELLVGRKPRMSSSPDGETGVEGSRAAPPPSRFNPSLRGEIDAIVSCAIAHDPAHRYSSLAELASDIRRFLAQAPSAQRRGRAADQLVRIPRRQVRRALLLATGAAAAGMAAKFAWEWMRSRG